jgi:hypothetical protein
LAQGSHSCLTPQLIGGCSRLKLISIGLAAEVLEEVEADVVRTVGTVVVVTFEVAAAVADGVDPGEVHAERNTMLKMAMMENNQNNSFIIILLK